MRTLFRLLVVVSAVAMPAAAYAQIDLTGAWGVRFHEDQLERAPGPELGDYLGLPITDGARQWALSWDPSRLTLPEHQCQVHVAPYIYRGPLQLRIWEERDPDTQVLIAIKQYISTYEQTRTIWMDGRPHPSEFAAHTWEGFSTGKFEGDMLTVYTTHIKQGWVRRNGLPESDKATLTEHFVRHGNILTHVSYVTDPVYLTEPLIKTQNFGLNDRVQTGQGAWLWPCTYVDEVANRPQGVVPNYLVGKNPMVKEFVDRYHLPIDAAMGGAKTMYPEYQLELEKLMK